jgi:hypothetical protein
MTHYLFVKKKNRMSRKRLEERMKRDAGAGADE